MGFSLVAVHQVILHTYGQIVLHTFEGGWASTNPLLEEPQIKFGLLKSQKATNKDHGEATDLALLWTGVGRLRVSPAQVPLEQSNS